MLSIKLMKKGIIIFSKGSKNTMRATQVSQSAAALYPSDHAEPHGPEAFIKE